MSSVDDVFAALKAADKAQTEKAVAKSSASRIAAGWGAYQGSAIPSKSSASIIATADVTASLAEVQLVQDEEDDEEVSAVESIEDVQQAQRTSLKREANLLEQGSASEKKGVLQRVLAALSSNRTPGDVVENIVTLMFRPLMRSIVDGNEQCRDTACRVLLQLFERSPDTAALMPYVMPTLLKRLVPTSSDTPWEPSEEVRLLLCLALSRLITLASKALAPFLPTVIDIVKTCLKDAYPEVRREGCHAIILLRKASPAGFKPHAEELIKCLTPSLRHRLARVRLAAVSAISACVLCGGSKSILELIGWREPNLVPIKAFFHDDNAAPDLNHFASLALDGNIAVRKAFVQSIGDWLRLLQDRLDYENRLAPYLLNGVADEVEEVRDAAWQALLLVGAQYEKDKEKELKDFLEYGQSDTAEQYAIYCWQRNGSLFPHPIKGQRPPIGVRHFVRNQVRGLVGAICRELQEWTAVPRIRSLRLLELLLILAEEASVAHLDALLVAVCKCCGSALLEAREDPDAQEVVRRAAQCASIWGGFIRPNSWLPLYLHTIENSTKTTPAPGIMQSCVWLCCASLKACHTENLSTDFHCQIQSMMNAAKSQAFSEPQFHASALHLCWLMTGDGEREGCLDLGDDARTWCAEWVVQSIPVAASRCQHWSHAKDARLLLSECTRATFASNNDWTHVLEAQLSFLIWLKQMVGKEALDGLLEENFVEDEGLRDEGVWASINACRMLYVAEPSLAFDSLLPELVFCLDEAFGIHYHQDVCVAAADLVSLLGVPVLKMCETSKWLQFLRGLLHSEAKGSWTLTQLAIVERAVSVLSEISD